MIRLTTPNGRIDDAVFLRSGRLLTKGVRFGVHVPDSLLQLWDIGHSQPVQETRFDWMQAGPPLFLSGAGDYFRQRDKWPESDDLSPRFWLDTDWGEQFLPIGTEPEYKVCFHGPRQFALVHSGLRHTLPTRFTLYQNGVGNELLSIPNCREGHGVFSPSGQRLVLSTGMTSAVQIWDMSKFAEECQLDQTARVVAVVFVTDDLLAVASGRTVRVWDVNSRKVRRKLPAFAKEAHHLAVSPDGSRLIGSSQDGTVRVWNTSSFDEIARYDWQIGSACNLAIAPDGLTAAVVGGTGVVVWDLE